MKNNIEEIDLKTIKNLIEESGMSGAVWSDFIKQEAIKWIKHFENHKDEQFLWNGTTLCCEHSACVCRAEPIIEWIIHFFNLDLQKAKESEKK